MVFASRHARLTLSVMKPTEHGATTVYAPIRNVQVRHAVHTANVLITTVLAVSVVTGLVPGVVHLATVHIRAKLRVFVAR